MCLALIAVGRHPLYPIIILSNRDEFYKRETLPAHYWQNASNLFAGQDLVGGGTWLGVNKQGDFSLVTNYRSPSTYNPLMKSRGLLVKDYLLESPHLSPDSYIKQLIPSANNYNLFNLIVGNLDRVICYSNATNKTKKLTTGLYGLSNHLLDTPWYKVLKAKELFNQVNDKLVAQDNPTKIEELLFPILENNTPAPDNLLPRTGVSIDLEKSLSPIFVNIPNHDYGTRSSTLILIEKSRIYFSEKIFMKAQVISSHNYIITH